MKRYLSLFLCLFLCLSLCSCTVNPYEEAVKALEQTTLAADGTYAVTEDLLIALENAEYLQPKNVIFMIGDGMGYNVVKAAETVYADRLYGGTLSMRHLPHHGASITYSADNAITDSAAGATALSTGFKTSNSTIAMNTEDSATYLTTLELAAQKGKSTGIIATKSVTDATPAGFTAHVGTRTQQEEIAGQQLDAMTDGDLDVVLGGGRSYYAAHKPADSAVAYVEDWTSTQSATLPLLGLYADEAMDTTDETLPTLAEMTDLAINRLSADENGFFLMVEGSQIDTFAHSNVLEDSMRELYAFDCAVAVAMRYVALHPDTVLIVTADHETGGLNLPDALTKDTLSSCYYSTTSHTGKTVPVYAVGYGTEALATVQENTDLAIFTASLLGEDAFGQQSTAQVLFDGSKRDNVVALQELNKPEGGEGFVTAGNKAARVAFSSQEPSLVFSASPCAEGLYPKAVRLRVKNNSETSLEPPSMLLDIGAYAIMPTAATEGMKPGETGDFVYILAHNDQEGAAAALKQISLMVFAKESLPVEILSLELICRPTGK